ncbi:MAG: hypothetical protein JWM68_3733 [Verrucomicrobiales bacterium]|nr:hypothetical protein [Verrucomicrobiales bacterium]
MIKIAVVIVGLAALGTSVLVYLEDLGAKSALVLVGAVSGAMLGISAFIAWNWFFQAKAKSIIQKWAAEQGYVILEFESPFHTGGFSFWTTSRGQVVYSVTVRDGAGCERKAWVRCGSFVGGVLSSDQIEVKWQDQPKAT